MKKTILLASLVALSLSGCAPLLSGLLSAGGAPAPRQAAERTTLDERFALGAETLYATAAEAGRLAFRLRVIQPTQSPAALEPQFCQNVVANRIDTGTLDTGGKVMALDCRAYAAVLTIRAAYEAGNATSYQQAYDRGMVVFNDMLRLIQGRQ